MVSEKRKKLDVISFYLFFGVIIALLSFCVKQISGEQTWFSCCAVLIVATALLQFLALRRYVRLISITSIFLILTYLFHFGIIINKGLFPFYTPDGNIYYLYELSFDVFKQAGNLCLISVLTLGLGILITAKTKRPIKKSELKVLSNRIWLFGWILLLIGAPFLISKTMQALDVYRNGSYLDSFDAVGDGSGIKSFLSNFVYAGAACLITYYSRRKKGKAILLWFAVSALQAINILFTGGRGLNLLMVLTLALVAYYNKLFKITQTRVFLLLIIAYLGVVALSTIADIRNQGMQDFTSYFSKNLGGYAILDIIQEMGSSIYTPYLCIEQRGDLYNLAFGKTYIASIVTLLPNLNGMFSGIINYSSFVKSLDGVTLGGSFIAEAYFNFGFLGVLITALIGAFVNLTDRIFTGAVIRGDAKTIAVLTPIVCMILWWVRDAANGFIRQFVWGAIIVIMIWFFIEFAFVKSPSVGRNTKLAEGKK